MHTSSVEVVVLDADGRSPALSSHLARLLAAGVDVVVPAGAEVGSAGGPGRVLACPDVADPVAWATTRLLGPGAPDGAVVRTDDPDELEAVIAAAQGFPTPVEDHAWRIDVDGSDPDREREVESWLTVGNGRTGTRGSLEEPGAASLPASYVAGVYGWDPGEQAGPELVRGPEWTTVQATSPPLDRRRTLDLRRGMVIRESPGLCAARFASMADRRLLVLQAQPPATGLLHLPEVGGAVGAVDAEVEGTEVTLRLQGVRGGQVWFAIGHGAGARLVAVDRDGAAQARDALAQASAEGVPSLLARHRRAWRDRWFDADVVVEGDSQAQRDLRFALYHLIIAADPESDLASVGARALTGPWYRGHVFCDT